jgi:hypothetical protein
MLGKEADLLRIKLANSSIPRTLEEAAQKRITATLPPLNWWTSERDVSTMGI